MPGARCGPSSSSRSATCPCHNSRTPSAPTLRTVRRVVAQLLDDGYLTLTDDRRRIYAPTMRLVALASQIVHRPRYLVPGSPTSRSRRSEPALPLTS